VNLLWKGSVPLHVEEFEYNINLLDDRLLANHEDHAAVWADVLKSLVPAILLVGNPEAWPCARWKGCDWEFGFDANGGHEV